MYYYGWRKANKSNSQGACVETANWRKASYSWEGSQCVETGDTDSGVAVRDTKANGRGPVLTFGADNWANFLKTVKAS